MEDRVEESITENREVEHEFGIVRFDGRDNFFLETMAKPIFSKQSCSDVVK